MNRVEAIARALNPGLWDKNLSPHGWAKLEKARQMALREAKKAADANDAWLAENGWKAVLLEPNGAMAKAANTQANEDPGMIPGCNIGDLYRAYCDASPSPDD